MMNKQKVKQAKLTRRHRKIRIKISGSQAKPRLNVFRSNKGMYLQLIDDTSGKTLMSVAMSEIKADKKTKIEIALEMGKLIAQKALAKKISEIVFDRGGYKYHGRVKAVADGAREAGLKF